MLLFIAVIFWGRSFTAGHSGVTVSWLSVGVGRIIALEIFMSFETIITINVHCGDTVFVVTLGDARPHVHP